MLEVGDRVRVKASVGGPELSPRLAHLWLRLWGVAGEVVDIVPLLDRPVVVRFRNPDLPREVRFWSRDLLKVAA